MRPTYIELAAFGSYRTKTALDMEKLGAQGLYLITGDTGAGKSTIFDAIAYALYGIASGDAKRDTMVMRNGAAQEDEETYVELRFTHNGGEYSVRRNMEYRRRARRGGGTTPEKENAVIRYPDGTVIEGVRRVNAAVEELLGIGSEHFTRILMIAQGDFARLLLSDTKDREPILRAIFGTHIFENFQRELVSRAGAMDKELAPLRARIEARFDPALYPEGHPARENVSALAEKPSAYRAGELISALQAGEDVDREDLKAVRGELEKAQQALNQAMEQLSAQRRLAQDNEELNRSRAELEKMDARREETGNLQKQAETAARAAYLDAPYRARENARKQESENRAAIAALAAEKMRLGGMLEEKQLAAEKTEAGRGAAETERRAAENIERQLAAYDGLAELVAGRDKLENQRIAAENAAADAFRKQQRMEDRAAEVDMRRTETSAALAELARVEALIREETARGMELKRLSARMDELAADKSAYGDMLNALRTAREAEQRASYEYENIRTRFLASQAGILASELFDGKPCPVCGSTVHPEPAKMANDAPDQAMMDAAERRAVAAREKTGTLAAESGAAKKRLSERFGEICEDLARITGGEVAEKPQLDELRARVSQIIDDIRAELVAHNGRQKELAALAREDAQLAKERAGITQELPKLKAERDAAEATREKCAAQAIEMNMKLAQLRASLEFSDRDGAVKAMNTHQKAFADWENAKKSADAALAACLQAIASATDREALLNSQQEAREAELAACDREFAVSLEENGFTGEEMWAGARMEPEKLNALNARLQEYARLREYHVRTAENLMKKLEGMPAPDVEAAEAARQAAQQRAETLTREDAALAARIDRVGLVINELKRDWEKFSVLGAKLENAQQLANVAAGRARTSMGRVTFERFILIDYFSRVLVQANLRFSRMAGGQYELVRARESSDMRLQTGLELNVVDHFTGRERSVRSLSGGEAFMASLSLALGFADVIRQSAGGVAVDAMFVDEGFGSLDPEALDQVMNTMTALAGGDKLIGIISHVADLKSRIPRRIIVEKTREGSSAHVEA